MGLRLDKNDILLTGGLGARAAIECFSAVQGKIYLWDFDGILRPG